jgi:hypothetical protein
MLNRAFARSAAFLLLAATPLLAQQRTPRKIALLIGIADYAHMGRTVTPTQELKDLQGSENDVERMRGSLRRWGFTDTADIRVLKGAQATRAGMMRGFEWLATRATNESDAVVIFYSGHGSNAPDGTDRDEPDGLDEGLVPFDAMDAHAPGQLLIDDQIRGYLARLGTQNVTMVVDACFSGTVTRGGGATNAKGPNPTPGSAAVTADRGSTDFSEARGHTLITAARSDQTAEEKEYPTEAGVGKVWLGALTYHLTNILDGAVATRALRYDDVIDRVASSIRGELLPQVPQLEGDRAALLFRSNTGIAARPFVLARVDQGRVLLDAGAIHGVRRNAVYDVFGAGELRFDSRPIAKVRVDSIVESMSFASGVDERGDTVRVQALPTGARAVLSRVPLGAKTVEKLMVFVDATVPDSIRHVIASDSARFVVSDSARAFARVTRARGVLEVMADGIALPPQDADGIVKREVLAEVVVSRGSRFVKQTRRDTIAGYGGSLCSPLIRALAISALEAIRNEAPPADLSADIRVLPYRMGPPTDIKRLSDADVIRVGDTVSIYARVDIPADVAGDVKWYMTAAIEGYTSDPFVLRPGPNDAPTPVPLREWIPLIRGIQVTEPAGVEVVKLVVNSDPYDLRPLVASFGDCTRAPVKGASRGKWDTVIPPVTGWTAVSRRVDIRRR